MRRILLLMLTIIPILSFGCSKSSLAISSSTTSSYQVSTNMILIDLKGEVVYPNLYSVKEGIILYELLNLAGGLTSDADISGLNLAQELTNNQMIIIPKKNDDNQNINDKININLASIDELMMLPGIGEAKAKSIIEYRKKQPFNTIEDIKNVSGIGDELFNKIKEYICT